MIELFPQNNTSELLAFNMFNSFGHADDHGVFFGSGTIADVVEDSELKTGRRLRASSLLRIVLLKKQLMVSEWLSLVKYWLLFNFQLRRSQAMSCRNYFDLAFFYVLS